MKENEIDESRVSAQRVEGQQITPPHIRQNEASDASESNAQKYLRRKFGDFPVQWLPLGEIGDVKMCKRILKHQTSIEGDVPFFKIGTFGSVPDSYISRSIFDELKNKYSYPQKGYILISTSGTIGKRVIFDGNDAYFQDSNIVWLDNDESIVLNKYLFYMYEIIEWNISKGGTIQRLYNNDIKRTIIPIPPMEVQNEVVEILDKFTALLAELKAELKARKLQYEYYRDQLLSFSDDDLNVQWLPLGEVCEIKRGKTITQKDVIDGLVPVISGGQKPAYYHNEYNREGETITIAGSGAYAGFIAYWNKPIFVADAFSIKSNEPLSTKYVYYFLKSKQSIVFKMKTGAGIPHVYPKDVAKLLIPIPPMDEQERIVGILDKFDTLTNSLTEGIPKEIEMRQMQYEYYRDALLSF